MEASEQTCERENAIEREGEKRSRRWSGQDRSIAKRPVVRETKRAAARAKAAADERAREPEPKERTRENEGDRVKRTASGRDEEKDSRTCRDDGSELPAAFVLSTHPFE
ncbi:uncharacterized protein LOC105662111 [Megachile rotundata]|uniref:uncharacterized protein LOC105662111 n=1 Tax=Megachile rotundata TaxID=143995 RepID=UPI000614EEA0|nr:PREDICTED: uncharacterized protein LOC105662111 [Megachile rotundata]